MAVSLSPSSYNDIQINLQFVIKIIYNKTQLRMADKIKQTQPQHDPQKTNKLQPSTQQHPSKLEHQQNSAKQDKQMRKIHERQQMPTDKGQLIQYLSERIKQAQEALNDTQEVLENQISERQKISKSISERNVQLSKLFEVDQKALPQKIKQKLTQILTLTINQKLEAEEQLQQQKSKNYEYKTRYDELKWQEQLLKHKLDELGSKQTTLNNDIATKSESIAEHQKELTNLEEEFQTVKEKKQALQNKYLQMKVALERMTDIKAVLNRFFANEDLFDQKMELKEQRVVRPQIDTPQQPRISQSRLPSRENRNTTKLKPLANSRRRQVIDDQDFWKGDFSAKTRNY